MNEAQDPGVGDSPSDAGAGDTPEEVTIDMKDNDSVIWFYWHMPKTRMLQTVGLPAKTQPQGQGN